MNSVSAWRLGIHIMKRRTKHVADAHAGRHRGIGIARLFREYGGFVLLVSNIRSNVRDRGERLQRRGVVLNRAEGRPGRDEYYGAER